MTNIFLLSNYPADDRKRIACPNGAVVYLRIVVTDEDEETALDAGSRGAGMTCQTCGRDHLHCICREPDLSPECRGCGDAISTDDVWPGTLNEDAGRVFCLCVLCATRRPAPLKAQLRASA